MLSSLSLHILIISSITKRRISEYTKKYNQHILSSSASSVMNLLIWEMKKISLWLFIKMWSIFILCIWIRTPNWKQFFKIIMILSHKKLRNYSSLLSFAFNQYSMTCAIVLSRLKWFYFEKIFGFRACELKMTNQYLRCLYL